MYINDFLACRHNDKTVELTGHTGHFWLDFDKADDAQEWWTAMQSLNIAKNRSSFIPYVATDNTEQKSKFPLTRIVNGRIDLLTPVELSADYHGHTQKTFFEPRGHFRTILQIKILFDV